MSKYIFVHFYELCLSARNKKQKEGTPLPPIENVPIKPAFKLLEEKLGEIKSSYSFDNNNYQTTIEHICVKDDKIELVFGYFDGLAPDRTLKNNKTGEYNIQRRSVTESVKYLCHCVIKLTDNEPLIANIGIENITGMPTSILTKTLNHYFKELEKIVSNAEGIFQITNPNNTKNSDGSKDIHKFILKAKFYPMIGEMLEEAILNGRFKKIRLNGKTEKAFDDPHNLAQHTTASLNVKVSPLKENEEPQKFLNSLIKMVKGNKFNLEDVKTFAIIENEAGNEQSIALDDNNALNSAFVLKKRFDATEGRGLPR